MSTQTATNAAEFERIAERLGPCELVNGEVVTLSPGGVSHSRLIIKLGRLLDEWAEPRQGWVAGGEMGIITKRAPDTVRGADIAYYAHDRLPENQAPEGFTEIAPNLVVEIAGRRDGWSEILEKVAEYLRIGVDRVWVIDPKSQRVHVYRSDAEPVVLNKADILADQAVLPGFECRIEDLFR